MFQEFDDLLQPSHKILVLIANNPDADSVGSALALAEIFQDLGKEAVIFCQVDIPIYLHFLTNWHQITKEWPDDYDLAVMVDNGTQTLLETNQKLDILEKLRIKPLVILDHHSSESDIDFALIYNYPKMVATGQLIYTITQELSWNINPEAAECLAAAILSDSLGFSSQSMSNNSEPLRVMAELVDLGVNLAELNHKRLKWQQIPAHLIAYKGDLLRNIEFYNNNQIALLAVDHPEIKEYSSFFNPTIVLDEMRLVEDVKLSLGFKQYRSPEGSLKRVTLRIRCHNQAQIAKELAEKFDGGGHLYAAGVKWEADKLDFNDIKSQVLTEASSLVNNLKT